MKDREAETPGAPLDHLAAVEGGLVERYHRGALSAEDEERFEAHYLECAECQEELELQRSFVRGLKAVATEEAVRSAVGLGLVAWLSRRAVATAMAAVLVVAVGLAFALLWRQNRHLETRIAELATGASPIRGEVTAPLVGVPVALLGVVRGEEGAPPVVNAGGGPYSLAVDGGADPRVTSYAVTILDEDGGIRFERHGLLPNDLEVIQVTFPADFLSPGDYRLVLQGVRSDGAKEELADHPFRVEER